MTKHLISALKSLAGVEDTDYPYYHVSNRPDTPTINTSEDTGYVDPLGVYLFIKGEHVQVPHWAKKKYRWDAKIKSVSSFLDVDNFGDDFQRIFKKLNITSWEAFWDEIESNAGAGDEDYDDIYDVLDSEEVDDLDSLERFVRRVPVIIFEYVRAHLGDRTKFTSFLQSLGYKGIIDKRGCCVFSNEPQVIVFNENDIIWGQREDNDTFDPYVYNMDE